jgi:hypothetical protein
MQVSLTAAFLTRRRVGRGGKKCGGQSGQNRQVIHIVSVPS